jgi:hypothetical protein
MNLGFIIEYLQKVEITDQDIAIAKGQNKILTKWSDAKEQMKWLKKR